VSSSKLVTLGGFSEAHRYFGGPKVELASLFGQRRVDHPIDPHENRGSTSSLLPLDDRTSSMLRQTQMFSGITLATKVYL